MANQAFFEGNQRKSLSSPERIGFHSVATVWFSFHRLLWLLRKNVSTWLTLSSAGSMFSSATGIFLSFPHAKVERERLVYFIVSNHSVRLNLYFIKWLGLNDLRRTKSDLLVTFFTFKDIYSIFWWRFCTFRNSACHQFLMPLSLDSITRVWFPSMLNNRKERLKFLRWLSFSSTETIGGQISTRARAMNCRSLLRTLTTSLTNSLPSVIC